MGSRYEVEVTVGSARDLKNVNWRNGDLKPYAVVWVDDGPKVSTRVDIDNAENPAWDEKLVVPLPPSTTRLEDAVLYIDVVHANAAEGVKPLVGSARLPLRDVLDDAGLGGKASRTLRLKRPSGRPQGRLDVRVAVREAARYYEPNPYPAPYGNPATGGTRDAYYATPPPVGYPAAAAGAGYAYGGGAPPQPAYGAAPAPVVAEYGAAAPAAGAASKKSGKMGMGTGLAVGAAAGVVGGLALAGGASYLENKFEDRVADRVEEDSYGGGGYDDDEY
ncbi:protein SRC2-like [Phragmites australis]|uniref:protein SRC2-like n=1 Tax=Phragmites australis TaxID=29695 RepID=UPI002D7819AD|nr:protein SRC2-like [Phragmites australis]